MGGGGSRFADQFDPAFKLPSDPQAVAAAVVAADDRVVAPVTSPRTAPRPWSSRHTAVLSKAPIVARCWSDVLPPKADEIVPLTILQLHPSNGYDATTSAVKQPPAARAAMFENATAAHRALQEHLRACLAQSGGQQGVAFVPPLCHVESPINDASAGGASDGTSQVTAANASKLADSGFTFVTLLGVFAPVTAPLLPLPAAAVDSTGAARHPDVPDDLSAHKAYHARLRAYRPRTAKSVVGRLPNLPAMPATECLLAMLDIASSLTAVHAAGVQVRNVHWHSVYVNMEAPGGRLPFLATLELQYGANTAMASSPGFQRRLADTVAGRGAAELPFIAPEDKDHSLPDDGRQAIPIAASDTFSFGVMLEQLLPPSAVEAAGESSAVSGSGPRATADGLARFAKQCQNANPSQRPSLGQFALLPALRRCAFVRVMTGLDQFYGGPSLPANMASAAHRAARRRTVDLLVVNANAEDVARCAFLSTLHVDLYRLPYELMVRRVMPRLFFLSVFNDPCASPLISQLLTAAPSTGPPVNAPALAIAAVEGAPGVDKAAPAVSATHPASKAPVPSFLQHGVLQEREHIAYCTSVITAPWAFGSPDNVATSPLTYAILALLRNMEGYIFSIDMAVINANVIPSVIKALLHPAADVAAEAMRCFGSLCKFVFAAVDRGSDVGTAKDQLVAAFDSEIFTLASTAGASGASLDLRLAALRITARSLRKHNLMTRAKAVAVLCSAVSAGFTDLASSGGEDAGQEQEEALTPVRVDARRAAEEALQHIEELATPSSTPAPQTPAAGKSPTNDGSSALWSSPPISSTMTSTSAPRERTGYLGSFTATEVVESILPALSAVAMRCCASAEEPVQDFGDQCFDAGQVLLAGLAELPAPPAPAESDGAKLTAGWCLAPGKAASSDAWCAFSAGTVRATPAEESSAAQGRLDAARDFAGPKELLDRDAHAVIVPTPAMAIDPEDGTARAIPSSTASAEAKAAADAAPLMGLGRGGAAEGHPVVVVPVVVPSDDSDAEVNTASVLSFAAIVRTIAGDDPRHAAAGSNLRPHPLAHKLSSRPDGGCGATISGGGAGGTGGGAAGTRKVGIGASGGSGGAGIGRAGRTGRKGRTSKAEEAALAAERAAKLAAELSASEAGAAPSPVSVGGSDPASPGAVDTAPETPVATADEDDDETSPTQKPATGPSAKTKPAVPRVAAPARRRRMDPVAFDAPLGSDTPQPASTAAPSRAAAPPASAPAANVASTEMDDL